MPMHGIVQNNPANDPDKKPVKSRSKFRPNYSLFQTGLFGYNHPFMHMEAVADDKLSVRVSSDVDTYTLQAPIMSPVKMNKDYFFASMRSLLPHNADLLITNPLSGDDVVPEDVNAVVAPSTLAGFYNVSGSSQYPLCEWLGRAFLNSDGYTTCAKSLTRVIAETLFFYQWTWWLLSSGSPARSLGYNFGSLFKGPFSKSSLDDGSPRLNYDAFLERLFAVIRGHARSFYVNGISGISATGNPAGTPKYTQYYVSMSAKRNRPFTGWISFHRLLELIQQGYMVTQVQQLDPNEDLVDPNDAILNFLPELDVAVSQPNQLCFINLTNRPSDPTSGNAPSDAETSKPVNILSLIAYQLSSVQFYTNDAIDYVYNANLWHENQLSLYRMQRNSNFMTDYFFQYNGMNLPYDSCSGHLLYTLLNYVGSIFSYRGYSASAPGSITTSGGNYYPGYAYLVNIFSFTRSLRYRDYFVGSKPRPMAVGNVNVTVSSGAFSVVDVSKNIQRQRFLNQVNRVGRSLKEYIRGIFGADPAFDPHEVVFLGSSTDVIGASETENTGAAQYASDNGITSKFRNDSSKFAFEGSFSEPGIVIGILNFDITRPLAQSMDREHFHIDRYDMFNPYMQTIGDQPIYGGELDLNSYPVNFGYQLRYAEYKQRYDVAAGGFIDFLPGYALIMTPSELSAPDQVYYKLSPDFIRSHTYDFDQFYASLINASPAGYFHFIMRHDIEINADRPMLAAPSIL